MTRPHPRPLRLIDDEAGPGRTTAALFASLAARLAALHLTSGANAIGSLTAGFAALGRETGRTAEGARLRRAIEKSRAGGNGAALWSALRIGELAGDLPPAPVLDQLRNDVALLLVEDLEAAVALPPLPGLAADGPPAEGAAPATFIDCLLGLWAFSRDLVRCVEALAASAGPTEGEVVPAAASGAGAAGPLLR